MENITPVIVSNESILDFSTQQQERKKPDYAFTSQHRQTDFWENLYSTNQEDNGTRAWQSSREDNDEQLPEPDDQKTSDIQSPMFSSLLKPFCPNDMYWDGVLVEDPTWSTICAIPFINSGIKEFLRTEVVSDSSVIVEEIVADDLLIVPPQHFENCGVNTETQTRTAFNRCLREWRRLQGLGESRLSSDHLIRHREQNDSLPPRSYVGVFVWRPSPTLNSKKNGVRMKTQEFERYRKSYGMCSSSNNEQRYNRVEICCPHVVTNICPILEVVMLAYRLGTTVINRVYQNMSRTHQSDSKDLNSRSASASSSNMSPGEDQNIQYHLVMQDCFSLWEVFFIFRDVVRPELENWHTYVGLREISELTDECCVLMIHLTTALRLMCAGRLQRLAFELKGFEQVLPLHSRYFPHLADHGLQGYDQIRITPSLDNPLDEPMYLGQANSDWASLCMGTAAALSEVYEAFGSFIDLRFGNLACPSDIQLQYYSVDIDPFADVFREYVTQSFLKYFTRALAYRVLTMTHKLEQVLVANIDPLKTGNQLTNLQVNILHLSEIGIAAARPIKNDGNPHADDVLQTFQNSIHITFPHFGDPNFAFPNGKLDPQAVANMDRNTGASQHHQDNSLTGQLQNDDLQRHQQNSIQSPHGLNYRICDRLGLMQYMTTIQEFLSDSACSYLESSVPTHLEHQRYFYVPPDDVHNPDSFETLKRHAVWVEIPQTSVPKKSPSSTQHDHNVHQSFLKSQSKWNELLKRQQYIE